MAKPALLGFASQVTETFGCHISTSIPLPEHQSQGRYIQPACRCRTLAKHMSHSRRRYQAGRWSVYLTTHTSGGHDQDCVLPLASNSRQYFEFGFSYFSTIVGYAMYATICMKTGAGGFSVSPALTIRPIVSCSAPVFKLFQFRELNLQDFSRETFIAAIDHQERIMYRMFRDGKASPFDVDENGTGLIWVSGIMIQSS